MRKRILCCSVIMVSLLLSACSSKKSNQTDAQIEDFLEGLKALNDDGEEAQDVPEYDSVEGEEDGIGDVGGEYVEELPVNSVGTVIIGMNDGCGYSEGYTWAGSDYYGDEEIYCIDKNGIIQFKLPINADTITKFHNGSAYYSDGSEQVIISTSGEILASPEMTGYDSLDIDPSGYAVAKKTVESFEESGTYYGIIGPDGNWVYPLSKDFYGMTYIDGDTFRLDGFYDENYNSYYIDVKTGKTEVKGEAFDRLFTSEDSKSAGVNSGYVTEKIEDDMDYREEQDIREKHISDGTINLYDFSAEKVASLKRTYNFENQEVHDTNYDALDDRYDMLGIFSEDMFYYDKVFYNANGEEVLSIRDKSVHYGDNNKVVPFFQDGACVVGVYNPQGTEYYGVIDKTGEYIISPKLVSSEYLPTISCGMAGFREDDYYNYYSVSTGELIYSYESDGSNYPQLDEPEGKKYDRGLYPIYSDDAVIIKENNEAFYIDKEGNRLF